MTSRKGTPDIMADLMTGNHEPAIKQESNKTISIASNKAIKEVPENSFDLPSSNKAIKPAFNKAIKQEGPKEKATFNLSVATLEALEDAWLRLRSKGQNKITKTLIVEAALEMALASLEAKGELSEIYRKLRDQY